MPQQESEGLLIQQAIEGKRAAFAALYDKCVCQVYRHVYYRVSSRSDAEDITQEVFIKAWKAISRYKKTGTPFVAWLIVIAHNLIVDYYKTRKKFVSLDETEVSSQSDGASQEAMTEASLNRSYIRSAISKLKKEKQKVILMRFIDGFSYAEIAKALNKSEGAVRVIQHRALNDLRHILTAVE